MTVLIERTACDFTSRWLIASLTAPVVEVTASAAIVVHPGAIHSAQLPASAVQQPASN